MTEYLYNIRADAPYYFTALTPIENNNNNSPAFEDFQGALD